MFYRIWRSAVHCRSLLYGQPVEHTDFPLFLAQAMELFKGVIALSAWKVYNAVLLQASHHSFVIADDRNLPFLSYMQQKFSEFRLKNTVNSRYLDFGYLE